MLKLKKALLLFVVAVLTISLVGCSIGPATQSSENPSSSVPDSSTVDSSEDSFQGDANGGAIGGDVVKSANWDGSVASGIAKGAGTKDAPYYIESAAEFAYALSEGAGRGYYYQLSCDIYLNDVSANDWMLNKNNNAWFTGNSFNGHLDGNGYCVYGLWIDPTEPPDQAGLVAWFSGGSITNLGLRYSFIIGNKQAGGFVGRAMQGDLKQIKNCFVDESVYVWVNSGEACGGILGYAYSYGGATASIEFENCYSKAQLYNGNTDKHRRANGIVGVSYDCGYSMKNCLAVNASPYYGPYDRWISDVVTKGGIKASEVYKNVYGTENSAQEKESWTTVSLDSIKGENAKTTLKGFDFNNTWQTVAGGTPKLRIFTGIDGKDLSVYDISLISLESFKKPAGKPAA